MASIRKRLIPFVLLLVAAGCRQASSPATSQPQRGGELVASLRSEPANYNRYFDASAAADLMAVLTQARLVRLNRVTDALEPALAERWESAADGRTHTLHLRKGITFSDGAPFTAADVVFSFAVAYEAAGSRLKGSEGFTRWDADWLYGSMSDGLTWNVSTPKVCSTTRPTSAEMGFASS